MESIARVRILKVMPASFAVNYHSSLWTSWISCRPVLWISMFRQVDFVQLVDFDF